MFKYLDGSIEIVEEDGLSSALMVTVKRDSYQHSDMARDFRFDPFGGGFANLQKETPNEMFVGKSVSCRVSTREEFNPFLMELVNNGNIYHCSKENVKDVWVFLEKDFTPDSWIENGITYSKITMEEFKARTNELIKDPYYF
ncbi:MAG: hypothetical protein ACRCVV_10240 [Shewanella sp.]